MAIERQSLGVRFSFEAVRPHDLAQLSRWRGAPHVKRWWPDPDDLASLEREFRPVFEGVDPTLVCICLVDARPLGFVQAYRFADEPAWRATIAAAIGDVDAVGIDYYIGEADLVGRGLGASMISAFVEHLWTSYPDAVSIVVAVQQDNVASWRSLERAGFERMWQGQLDSDHPGDEGPSYVYVVARPR